MSRQKILLSSFLAWTLVNLFCQSLFALGGNRAPAIRIKSGVSSLKVNAGERIKDQPLGSLVTFQPSILWAVPDFSSRIGVHYLQELGSNYGLTPLQGIGLSGYYYFFGVSTSYNDSPDGVLFEKSRMGPYLMGSLTPSNFNLNKTDGAVSSENFFFSALIYDVSVGLGFDYPINQNMVLAGEVVLRNGSGADSANQAVRYSGTTFYVSFLTTYF